MGELRATGDRTVVTVGEARDIAKAMRKQLRAEGFTCQIFTLRCRAWKVEALRELKGVMASIASTVVCLKIDDIVASLDTETGLATYQYLADAFRGAPQLGDVDLSDNAMGTRGMDILQPLLRNKRGVSFHNCGLAVQDCETLYNLYKGSGLRSLDLGRNQVGEEGAKWIGMLLGTLGQLRAFSYDGTRPLKAGSACIAEGLVQCRSTKIVKLNLKDNDFGPESNDGTGAVDHSTLDKLCACLQKQPSLVDLDLSDNSLEWTGLDRVLKALAVSNAPLNSLNLEACEIGLDGAKLLRQFVMETVVKDTLHSLNVAANELENDGTLEIVAAAGMIKHLAVLNLNENMIEAAPVKALIQSRLERLKKLQLEENMEIPLKLAKALADMYEVVKYDEDLEDDEGEEEDDENDEVDTDPTVDDLTGAMAAANI
jgi:Ran GTPase-activating protein (RanGAP) involved in mRNA processing and transport